MLDEGIEVLGGNGCIDEHPLGRPWRDARLSWGRAGTSEIRQMQIRRKLLSEAI
jgi:isovaleryl-CoA dehydrogenase